MKVVINNWREDGEKEAVDDWSGITMDYLIHAALHTEVRMRYCNITHRFNYGGRGK